MRVCLRVLHVVRTREHLLPPTPQEQEVNADALPSSFSSPTLPAYRSITSETKSWATALNEPLLKTDPDLYAIIEQEKIRQQESLVLIASENFTSK